MHGVGLNVTVMSYLGGLNFGVVADRDMVDDPWPLADALARAQAELVALVGRNTTAKRSSIGATRRERKPSRT